MADLLNVSLNYGKVKASHGKEAIVTLFNDLPELQIDGVFNPTKAHLQLFKKEATRCFEEGKIDEAAFWFREARDASLRVHGEFSLQSASAYYKYGIALMSRIPVSEPDPLANALKAVDHYFQTFDVDQDPIFAPGAEEVNGGFRLGNSANNLEAAKTELKLAWSIMQKQPKYSQQKVKLLVALGEVEFREGDSTAAEDHYIEALHILESLDGDFTRELADIYAKTYICLKQRNADEAKLYGSTAFSYYTNLPAEIRNEARTSAMVVQLSGDIS